ncbi:hypothetical protein [Ectothiorhodospira lacustris]|uniref:hypothetical protein n=1 Tax=Ectothiorhodospira lacustris TaxID=2899127 RepID=UPI001EE82AD3|nr:hypothetical protein [Ectothiorhodospira lacustris]MCG5500879.1 hypothetical protein [Ectothiorhodospira lacustris]MCG5511387.1 hypothetical protein [Ectothiorhodospira lacustris]MCG5523212.1 hypothetical protein [Ectothiorhodospira lacustris]
MRRLLLPVLILLAAGLSGPALALDGLRLGIGDIQGEGWSMEGVSLDLSLGQRDALDLQVERLRLPEPLGTLRQVRLHCQGGGLDNITLDCPQVRVMWRHPDLGQGTGTGRMTLRLDGRLDLDLTLTLESMGRFQVRLLQGPEQWQATMTLQNLPAEGLLPLIMTLSPSTQDSPLDGALLRGALSGRLRAAGGDDGLQHLSARVSWRSGAFAGADGMLAGEDLSVDLELEARQQAGRWQGRLDLAWTEGGGYVHPVYAEASREAPGRLGLSFRGASESGDLQVEQLDLTWGEALQVVGRLRLDTRQAQPLREADLILSRGRLPVLYETFLQPFLYGTVLEDLETLGLVSALLQVREGELSRAVLTAVDVHLDDRLGRLGLYGMDGRFLWAAEETPPASSLGFLGGHVYGIPLGNARLRLQLEQDGLRLLEPARIPILDGALEVETLKAQSLSGGDPVVVFDGRITPIAMELLAAAVDRPLFTGTLAGVIPQVRYQGGELSVGGRLLIHAFDGLIMMRNLRLQDPFGVAPVLSGDMDINHLDLAALTGTFAFGRIEGRLQGHVHDLVLVNWEPVHFDAALYTPLEGTFRRRISQRAVDNLVSLGGGVGGVLGTGFLRFFESFAYRQLGLSCRLRGDVCEMSGVAPAPTGGYFIVQGAGLPRIQVVGFTRQVAWRDLVHRLVGAVQSGEFSTNADD